MSPRFIIYYVPSGMGLVKDASVLQSVLHRLGFDVQVEPVVADIFYPLWQCWLFDFLRKINFIAIYKKLGKLLRIKSNVYAIHLENIIYKKCYLNQHHILIPNQEWFEPRNVSLLQFMSVVWCKTRFAEDIFREMGARVDYIGFASLVDGRHIGLAKSKDYFFRGLARVGIVAGIF